MRRRFLASSSSAGKRLLEVTGRSSRAVSRSIQYACLSQTPPRDADETYRFQAQCIANLGNVLKAAGSSWEKVVKVNVYLKNMDDFASMNEVYEKRESC